ncbi:MAG: FAD-binding oxidoreductase [Acetobacteraceae bacterium]|nr:FAD-binding oxidoreductase [Acetobacteraceae bacterium]
MTARRLPLPPSLYAETARPAPETPPVEGDRRVSVAVVGGGFTGLSTALSLAQLGVDVAVLEAHEPGWGASGRNGGQVNPGLKHDPDQVERDFGPDLGARMVALSGNAPNLVFSLVQRHQIACGALQSGTLRAACQPRQDADIRTIADQWLRRGAPSEWLDQAGCEAITGARRYTAAFLDRRGGQLNPLGYARGLAQAAIQAGAAVHGASPALSVKRDGGAWHVATPSGTMRAEKLVLATNGYTTDLWPKLRRSIVPVFSAIVASERLPEALAQAILPTRSVVYEVGSVTVYYRLDRDNRLLMGGRSVQRDLSRPAELRYLIAYALRLWPVLRGIKWTHAWSGQLAITPDHYPHIHEPAEGVLVCLAYNGRGVAMATAMGPELAKRIVGGKAAEIDMPITGIKEIPFHGLWKSAVAARVTYGRMRDWLGV